MINIVGEIITEIKNLLPTFLVGYNQLDYELSVEKNNERALDNGYGFISVDANYIDGKSMGFITVDHTFQLILSKGFQNKDDDTAQALAINELYSLAHGFISNLQKKPFSLPTIGFNVLLISGQSIGEAESNLENGSVLLRQNINIQYRYKKV